MYSDATLFRVARALWQQATLSTSVFVNDTETRSETRRCWPCILAGQRHSHRLTPKLSTNREAQRHHTNPSSPYPITFSSCSGLSHKIARCQLHFSHPNPNLHPPALFFPLPTETSSSSAFLFTPFPFGVVAFSPAPAFAAGFSASPSLMQSSQNHSPSGMDSRGGVRQVRWKGFSHCGQQKLDGVSGPSSHGAMQSMQSHLSSSTHSFTFERHIFLPVNVTDQADIMSFQIFRPSRQFTRDVIGMSEPECRELRSTDTVKVGIAIRSVRSVLRTGWPRNFDPRYRVHAIQRFYSGWLGSVPVIAT